MELFHKAKAVRLRSHHDKYLTAEEEEESVTQARNGASKNARWSVEFLETDDNIIRLKSCYGKYLMASNMPFLLGMTGRKLLQTAGRKDSSVEWEPIREGNQVKLRTRHGTFLQANGPPWPNSVTHSVPNRTAMQDWILWDVDVVEIPLLQLGKISGEEGWISLGPWGGEGGVHSEYKPDGPIMQITICYGYVIESILFESKSRDGVVIGSSVKIGGTSGTSSAKFCINSSVEQFSSVSLTYKDYDRSVVVTSLCFNTNLKKYGPFGSGGGHSLFIPIEGEVITGFHGRGGRYLDAIGILVAPKVDSFPNSEINVNSLHSIEDPDSNQLKGKISGEEGWISLGPWGGEGGVHSEYKPDGPIMQITIRHGYVIESILFESKSRDGVVIGSSVRIGGAGGRFSKKFCIDSSVEQFSSLSLTYNESEYYFGRVVVTSLCFNTNLKKYGPFGLEGGRSVFIPIEGEVITGFHGRGDLYLDAIGIFVAPKVDSFPNSEINVNSLHSIEDPDSVPIQLKGKIIADERWISLGPWGGEGGGYITYKPDGPIMKITICYGAVIYSILFESKSRDGVVIGSSKKIGGASGSERAKFCIDSSVEQFSSVSLTYNDYGRSVVVTSLCFNTNLKKYGPFGSGGGHYVSIPIEGGVIAGFHGRGGYYLHAIGIFVAPKVDSFFNSEKNIDSLHSNQDLDSAPTQLKGKIRGEEGCISLGPWGGNDGEAWAYKADGPIIQISVSYGKAIYSILFQSRRSDGLLTGSSEKIGGTGGYAIEMFCIDTSEEQLSSISLTYEFFTITSLCIHTNLNTYGPFGSRSGASSVSIPIPIEGGVLIGFHGRTDDRYITAIGIIVAPKVNSWHPILNPDSVPTNLQVLGSGKGSNLRTLENIIHNAASSSATTNKDDHHAGAPSSSSEMIRNDLFLVKLALKEYMDHMNVQINLASEKFEELQKSWSSERDFDELRNAIAKLKFQIPLTTNKDDHHGGALSPTSKKIRSDLILVDTAFVEAKESMYHMNVKINKAHEKFNDLQILPSSEIDSDELRKADFDKKRKANSDELRKAIAKLKVQIPSPNKFRSAHANLHHKNWDNINGAEDGMMHFFHNEPEVAYSGDFDGRLKVFRELPEQLSDCLLCFFKFPPEATIKRTPMIYLWIGQGYISWLPKNNGYIWDVEVHAGKIFDELIAKGFIEPIYQNYSLVPDSCRMSRPIRSSLYEEAKRRGFTSNGTLDLDPASVCGDIIRHSSCLINVGEAIINFQPEIFEDMKHIQSLYLGRWQSSATHHIELADGKILHGLNKLNKLTFLSLRGISMITELPTFISELNNLMILDLRACHNLEVIPDDIGLLKSLTHLDMSECYFLEHMPESLAYLSKLQVLKGFLIGDFDNNRQSCTLLDLSRLQELRKLNIYISVKDLFRLQDLEYLERIGGLKKLTISWGGCSLQARAEDIAKAFDNATLPPRLQKLDLQCFPTKSLPDNWMMPGKHMELKKLYIRGGHVCYLQKIQEHQGDQWAVEILHLEYLSKLNIDWRRLRILFPKLIYLHQAECPNFTNFPCDERGVWMDNKAINTHVQLQKYLKTSGRSCRMG